MLQHLSHHSICFSCSELPRNSDLDTMTISHPEPGRPDSQGSPGRGLRARAAGNRPVPTGDDGWGVSKTMMVKKQVVGREKVSLPVH